MLGRQQWPASTFNPRELGEQGVVDLYVVFREPRHE